MDREPTIGRVIVNFAVVFVLSLIAITVEAFIIAYCGKAGERMMIAAKIDGQVIVGTILYYMSWVLAVIAFGGDIVLCLWLGGKWDRRETSR